MSRESKQFKADHGEPFNADSATIIHGEGSVVIDFKHTTPRVDQVDDEVQHTVITQHEPIVLDPQMAKVLLNLLQENLSNYEDKFGEIEIPDQDSDSVGGEVEETHGHGYIG